VHPHPHTCNKKGSNNKVSEKENNKIRRLGDTYISSNSLPLE